MLLLHLWRHECSRVFADRLVDEADKAWFDAKADEVLGSRAANVKSSSAPSGMVGVLFGSFLRNSPDDPTTGTYGGIARGTWNFWRSQYYRGVTDGGAAVSASNIQQYMTTLALRCVRGSNKPDLWIGDATYFSYYVNSLQAIQRINSMSGDGKADVSSG